MHIGPCSLLPCCRWVTAVTYTPDGRIVSGGMDSKLWLWPASGTRGMKIDAHFGPISQVKCDYASGNVVSASYDKTLRVWQIGARAHELACLQVRGHPATLSPMLPLHTLPFPVCHAPQYTHMKPDAVKEAGS